MGARKKEEERKEGKGKGEKREKEKGKKGKRRKERKKKRGGENFIKGLCESEGEGALRPTSSGKVVRKKWWGSIFSRRGSWALIWFCNSRACMR